MGLVPGTAIRVITIAPLGDPLRIEIRGGEWSMRRAEAAQIEVEVGAGATTGATERGSAPDRAGREEPQATTERGPR